MKKEEAKTTNGALPSGTVLKERYRIEEVLGRGGFGITYKVFDTNLKSVYFLTKQFVNYFIKNEIKGNILNISSSSSLRPGVTPYTIAKWGMKSFTQGMAKSLVPYGITVNSLAPGPTHTPMHVSNGDEGLDEFSNPTGRMADAVELANMAVILVSKMGNMVVGDTVYMTGGAGVLTLDDVSYDIY